MSKSPFLLAAFAAGALFVAACNGTLPAAPVVSEQPAGTVSFAKDVSPLLTTTCAGCHDGPGGSGSRDVQIFDEAGKVIHANVAKEGAKIVSEVLSGKMPRGRSRLTAAEAGTLQKWVAAGALNN